MIEKTDKKPEGPGPGDQAPDFSLPDWKGETVNLNDSNGRWLVLYFYPRDSTSGCTKEAQDFTDLLPEFRKEGAEVIGISPDSPDSHRRFREKHGLSVTLLSDEGRKTLKNFGAWGAKKIYGKETRGVIRSTFLIDPEGVIARVWRNVRVRSKSAGKEVRHADEVLEQLIKSKV